MPRKGNKRVNVEAGGRINLIIPPELESRLNQYIVKIVERKGKIPHAIRTKIARKALEQWLDRNESNMDINGLLKEEED